MAAISVGQQLVAEQGEDLFEGVSCGRAGYVDKVFGKHRVGVSHHCVGVRSAVVELNCDKRVAQLIAKEGEAAVRNVAVSLEAQAHDTQAFARATLPYNGDVLGRAVDRTSPALGEVEGHRGLRQNGGDHR